MTDHQTIRVLEIDEKLVDIEVTETTQSRAISCLVDRGEARGIDDGNERTDRSDMLKIAAMLLLGDKAIAGELDPPEQLEPEQLVTKITPLETEQLGTGDSNNPIYRAVLRIEVKRVAYAKLFSVGDTFGAVADIGGDLDDMFG